MNNVTLLGRLVRDPECRYTQRQKAMTTFTLAVDRGKDKDGKDKGADFIRIVVWGSTAEVCEKYLKKGKQVAIEGRIQTGSYDKNGQKVYTTDVVANRVHFIYDGQQKAEQGQEPKQQSLGDSFAAIDEDVPF